MASESTENDEEIARILFEEESDFHYEEIGWHDQPTIRSATPILAKPFRPKELQQASNAHFSSQLAEEYAEMALIEQIEEIVLYENRISKTTTQVNDAQLVKTHAEMTKALKPTEQTDLMARIVGMFGAIQKRYDAAQEKNQELTNQIQKLALHLYPTLIALKAPGPPTASGASPAMLGIGLITNVLQGNIGLDDARGMMDSMLKLWQESSVWYEFLEQLVYMLVAVTVPAFAQGAMGKLLAKVSL